MSELENQEVVTSPSAGANTELKPEPVKKAPFGQGQRNDRRGGPDRGNRPRREEKNNDGINQKLIAINRVTKTVKGGRKLSFSALVAVGDGAGMVGMGMGKAAEIPVAVEKAVAQARRSMVKISLAGHTIPHDVIGKHGSSTVILLPAREGHGVIAGGSSRALLELAGVQNISCKSYGSRNKINNVRACLNGLSQLRDENQIAQIRGIKKEG